jgi:hypothetical protein
MMWTAVIGSTSVGPSLRLHTAMIHRCAQVHIYCIENSLVKRLYFSTVCHVYCNIANLVAGNQHTHGHSWHSSSGPPAASQAERGLVAAAVPDGLQCLPPRIRGAAAHLLQRQVRRRH